MTAKAAAFDIADPERRLALAYAPRDRRGALAVLWALDERLGSIVAATREAMLGEIRLAWWRDALAGLDEITPAGLLGDIVLCPQVAVAQAEEAGHSVLDELLLLTAHGMLHLLGFDHAEPDDEKEMFGIQRDILVGFTLAERKR